MSQPPPPRGYNTAPSAATVIPPAGAATEPGHPPRHDSSGWGEAPLVIALFRKGRLDRLTGVLACAFAGLPISPVSWSHHWVWVVPFILWATHHTGTHAALTPTQARQMRATQSAPARASTTARMTTTIAAAWVVMTAGRFIWATPSGDGREFLAPPAVKLLADGYTLLGVATLILLTAAAHRRLKPAALEPASPPAPRP